MMRQTSRNWFSSLWLLLCPAIILTGACCCQENKVIWTIAAVLRHLARTHDQQCGVFRGLNLVNVQKKREGQNAGARPIDHPRFVFSLLLYFYRVAARVSH